jgi:hypothetical protein
VPPYGVSYQTVVANGRIYGPLSPGSYQDVIDIDAAILAANGWTKVCMSGPTSSRPNATMNSFLPNRIDHYLDTTLSKVVAFDGQTWRDPVTGNAV